MVCAASFLAQMPFHPAPISELSLTAASEWSKEVKFVKFPNWQKLASDLNRIK